MTPTWMPGRYLLVAATSCDGACVILETGGPSLKRGVPCGGVALTNDFSSSDIDVFRAGLVYRTL